MEEIQPTLSAQTALNGEGEPAYFQLARLSSRLQPEEQGGHRQAVLGAMVDLSQEQLALSVGGSQRGVCLIQRTRPFFYALRELCSEGAERGLL